MTNTQMQEAIELRQNGQLEEARTKLLDLLLDDPDDPVLLYQVAWTYDNLGLEAQAMPYYEQALANGLQGEDRQGAMLGLGSTYRTLAHYDKAAILFKQAIQDYPEAREFKVFYAMVLYNLEQYAEGMQLLMTELAETTNDKGIERYQRAILFYADKLDQVWE